MTGRPGRLGILGKSACSGLILSFAFPPLKLSFVAFVGLLPLLLVLEDLARANARRPLRAWAGSAMEAGWTAGFVYFLALVWWIVLLDAPALTIPWVRYPGTLAIAAYLGLYTGLGSLAYAWVRARTGFHPALAAPALWTMTEVARGYWELGFPWGHLGYSQVAFLPALQIASVAGVHGITAWVVAINALCLGLLPPAGPRPGRIAVLLLVTAVPIAFGAFRLSRPLENPTVRVALVQPNVRNAEKWNPKNREAIFETLSQLSRQGVDAGADLIVWPETAAPCYLLKDQVWRPHVESLAAELSVPIFLGLPDYQIVRSGGGKRVAYTNTGVLFDEEGSFVDRMDKIELVPFGERVPFSQYFPALDRIDFGEADFVPGERGVIFEVGDWKFANLVCFEAIFPSLSRGYANDGAEILVNITNDSWFGADSGARQHADMAVVRCVETGCGMARCANSGISLGADSRGRTFGETTLFTRDLSVIDVPLRRGRTFYARTGDWVPGISLLAAAAMLVAAHVRRPG